MNRFFRKKRSAAEVNPTPARPEDDFQNTSAIDTAAISAQLKKGKFARSIAGFFSSLWAKALTFAKQHRILAICISIVLIASIVSVAAFEFIVFSNPLYGYSQVAMAKGSVMRVLPVEGTLESGERYEITSLVSGKVIDSAIEVGDYVSKNDILYRLDDTEAKFAVERAKNEANMAADTTSSAPTTYRIISSESGTIQSLSIYAGSTVSPGSQVGTLLREDGTTTSITSYVSGTVSVLSVRSGQNVSPGQIIASVNTKTSDSENNREYYKRSTEIELQVAQRQLDKYSIKSPVSGIVVEKNIKSGDNVNATDFDKPMMVILDTSNLKFTFTVDEHKVRELEKGQDVSVKSDSLPDANFSGVVSAVSHEGVMSDDGNLIFTVTVTVKEPGDLRAGMKVSGTVVLDSVQNVLSAPANALMESDGSKALVFVKADNSDTTSEINSSAQNEIDYPHIKVPKGCRLVSVKYGLSDGVNVQIKSGLKLGDIVIYNPKAKSTLVENIEKKDTKKKIAPSVPTTPPSDVATAPPIAAETPDASLPPSVPYGDITPTEPSNIQAVM